MSRPSFFAFYPADFANDINVEAMSTLQVGAYVLLLCKAWQSDPPASLPNDDQILARFARVDAAVWQEIRAGVLVPFRLGTDGKLHSKRLRLEYDNALKRMRIAKENGRKGGRPKSHPDKEVAAQEKPSGLAPGYPAGNPQANRPGNLTESSESPISLSLFPSGIGEGEELNPPLPPAKPGGAGGRSPQSKRARSPKPPKPLAESVPVPAPLDTPAFREVWAEWLAARREKANPVTARAAAMQFKTLTALGAERAAACVEASIANDWTGIFPGRKSEHTLHAAPRPIASGVAARPRTRDEVIAAAAAAAMAAESQSQTHREGTGS